MILLAAVTVYFYVVFDFVAVILISDQVLHGKPVRILQIMKESFRTISGFISIGGAVLVFYVSILVPLCGQAVTISLTENFSMPYFISSVINANPLYFTVYHGLMVILFVLGLIYSLTFQYVVLDGRSVFLP